MAAPSGSCWPGPALFAGHIPRAIFRARTVEMGPPLHPRRRALPQRQRSAGLWGAGSLFRPPVAGRRPSRGSGTVARTPWLHRPRPPGRVSRNIEETGLRVSAERLTGVYYERQGPGREAVHFAFLCGNLDETAVPQPDQSEVTACGYWSSEALPRPISDFTIRRIQDALTTQGPLLPATITTRQWLT